MFQEIATEGDANSAHIERESEISKNDQQQQDLRYFYVNYFSCNNTKDILYTTYCLYETGSY